MFSTLLTSPRAPLSRSHSTALMQKLEFDGCVIVLRERDERGDQADQRRDQRDPPHAAPAPGDRTDAAGVAAAGRWLYVAGAVRVGASIRTHQVVPKTAARG